MGTKRAATDSQQPKGKRLKGLAPPPKVAESIVNEELYGTQLAAKKQKIEALFKDMHLPKLEVYESKKSHFRQRVEFRVWQSADDLFYVMFSKLDVEGKKGKAMHEKQRINDFPVASEMINKLMKAVLEYIKERHVLRHKLFQANFQTTLSGEAMVTLVYHTALLDTWNEPAKELRQFLKESSGAKTLHLVGRSKNQKVELDQDFVLETMQVDNHSFIQKQVEGAFSQPNGDMCQNMLSWARDVTRSTDGDMLELYCGNGNFTVALADNFREIVATEVSKVSVHSARYNLEANGIKNVHIARLSSEEFTQAWRGEREFYRMKDFPDITHRKFKTLLVDPPRAGLDDDTVDLLKTFENAVYVSCNPNTLHGNLQKIKDSHKIERFAIFDQFPYTDHIECGVYLTKSL